jgi:hypothetical protein
MPNFCDKQNNRAEKYEQMPVQNSSIVLNRTDFLFKTFSFPAALPKCFEQVGKSYEQVLNRLSTGYEHLSRLLVQVLTIIRIEIWVIAWDKTVI